MGNGAGGEREGGQIHASALDRRGEPTIERVELETPTATAEILDKRESRVVCVATKITTIIIRRVLV